MTYSPPFGQADLSNCERELIHLAGSIQPYGVLLVLRESDLAVLQASRNAAELLGLADGAALPTALAALGGDLAERVRMHQGASDLSAPLPLHGHTLVGGQRRDWEGALHRHAGEGIVLELEPVPGHDASIDTVGFDRDRIMAQVAAAVQRFSNAASIGVLADATVQCVRDITGYDRVMVYKFDSDGHGKIVAEARDPRLDSLLGHHYPATDIPQRARELYIRNRVRVLVDVHYTPSPLVSAPGAQPAHELDMSLCYLRSMSPLHLQYLKNMGVTGTLVVSLVREGRLWGLIAAHHYAPRNLRFALRAACELLGEVVSTRIAAIENYAHAQVAILVRRLQQRLIEATSTEGDWRLALFRNPRTLLQPLEATGAVLFHDGEILSSGEVPSTPELRALLDWIGQQGGEWPFACNSVAKANPALESLTPLAAGVLAIRLSAARPDYLVWFRKEQLQSVTWAGDPSKPMVGNDPLELSPRRSFAAWSEIVRGTALPWTHAEITLARAVGVALVDIIVQVHAVRLLIAEDQLKSIRATVEGSGEAVVVADGSGQVLFANEAFLRLGAHSRDDLLSLQDVALLFTEPQAMRRTLESLKSAHQPWRGELMLRREGGPGLPVAVRAEVVAARDGHVLGHIMILLDMSDSRRAAEARRHLEQSMQRASLRRLGPDGALASELSADEVIGAILTNASLAAMDIADSAIDPSVPALLEELEASTQRATALYGQIRDLSGSR